MDSNFSHLTLQSLDRKGGNGQIGKKTKQTKEDLISGIGIIFISICLYTAYIYLWFGLEDEGVLFYCSNTFFLIVGFLFIFGLLNLNEPQESEHFKNILRVFMKYAFCITTLAIAINMTYRGGGFKDNYGMSCLFFPFSILSTLFYLRDKKEEDEV